ncbi:MAG: SMI1/KNR4 family protein [Pseudomonadota bacterium]
MSSITEKLDALLAAFKAKGIDPSNNLRPGLSDAELDAWSSSRGIVLPNDVRELYRWRNGSVETFAEPQQVFVFRDNGFLSLDDYEQAFSNIDAFLKVLASYGVTPPISSQSVIPIAELEGNYYVVATTSVAGIDYPNPVLCVGEDLAVHFYSLDSMLDTCLQWVLDPTYSAENQELDNEIDAWEQHNPGVFDIDI